MPPANLTATGPAADELRTLRVQLADLGYTTERVRDLLRIDAPAEALLASSARYSLLYRERLEDADELAAVLALLFLFGVRVPTAELDRLPARLVSGLRARGFVADPADDPGYTRAQVGLCELRGRYFLSDQLFENRDDHFVFREDPDTCMPVHASSLELLDALRPPPGAGALLDVGCGSGCQSIVAAPAYARITGFDLGPRSVEFARTNAVMNAVDARYVVADCLTFDDATRYDHVVFNAPGAELAFAFLTAGLGRVLAADGVAQIWCSYPVSRRHASLEAEVGAALADHPELAVEIEAHPASGFSLSRDAIARRSLPRTTLLVDSPAQRDELLDRLAARDIVEIVAAVLTVRRRS